MTGSSAKKLEKLWQEFERTGAIQAYLQYQALKQKVVPAKGHAKKAVLRASR